MVNKGLFTSQKQNWKTPLGFYKGLNEEFHFTHDPCIADDKATWDTNGLYDEWGECNFVNPPYSHIKEWVAKAYQEYLKGKTIVLLIPSRTDTRWWHDYCMLASEIRFIKGRLCFNDDNKPAPFPSCIVIFKHDIELKRNVKAEPTLHLEAKWDLVS